MSIACASPTEKGWNRQRTRDGAVVITGGEFVGDSCTPCGFDAAALYESSALGCFARASN
jgi:hypothetical protein